MQTNTSILLSHGGNSSRIAVTVICREHKDLLTLDRISLNSYKSYRIIQRAMIRSKLQIQSKPQVSDAQTKYGKSWPNISNRSRHHANP